MTTRRLYCDFCEMEVDAVYRRQKGITYWYWCPTCGGGVSTRARPRPSLPLHLRGESVPGPDDEENSAYE